MQLFVAFGLHEMI